MRIALIIHNFKIGGVQKVVLDLITHELLSKEQIITIGLSKKKGDLFEYYQEASYRTYRFPFFYPLPSFPPYRISRKVNKEIRIRLNQIRCHKLFRKLNRESIDLVHSHISHFPSIINFIKYSSFYNIPCIITLHGDSGFSTDECKMIIGSIESAGNCRRILITNVTEKVNQELIYFANLRGIPNLIINNGVDIFKYSPSMEKRVRAREIMGVSDEKTKIIGTVGRLRQIKGQDLLVDAFTLLENKNNLKLVFIGEGENLAILQKKISDAEINDNVLFLGERNDIALLLSGIDIYIQPSRSEGLSLSLLEAMVAGLPIIATDVGGSSSVIKDGVSGLLIPPESIDELSAAIKTLVSSPEKCYELSKNAQLRSLDFSLETTVTQYKQVYQDLININSWHS